MICPQCKTEIQARRIVFGKAGYIEVDACECEATKLTLKYSNSEFRGEDERRA